MAATEAAAAAGRRVGELPVTEAAAAAADGAEPTT